MATGQVPGWTRNRLVGLRGALSHGGTRAFGATRECVSILTAVLGVPPTRVSLCFLIWFILKPFFTRGRSFSGRVRFRMTETSYRNLQRASLRSTSTYQNSTAAALELTGEEQMPPAPIFAEQPPVAKCWSIVTRHNPSLLQVDCAVGFLFLWLPDLHQSRRLSWKSGLRREVRFDFCSVEEKKTGQHN